MNLFSAFLTVCEKLLNAADVDDPSTVTIYVTAFLLVQALILVTLVVSITAWLFLRERFNGKKEIQSKIYEDQILTWMLDPSPISQKAPRGWKGRLLKHLLNRSISNVLGTERERLLQHYRNFGFLSADLKKLSSHRWWKRLAAVIELDYLQDDLAAPALMMSAGDSNPLVALSSMQSLSALTFAVDSQERLGKILTTLQNVGPAHRFAVTEILTRLARQDGDFLLGPIEADPNGVLGNSCITVLGECRAIVGIPVLQNIVADSARFSDSTVAEAATALGRMGDPRSAELLRLLLTHSAPQVRARALVALSRLVGTEAHSAVEALRADESIPVRRAIFEVESILEGSS